jgi:23S rRNA (cytosine1962-C5)-methyltransferase
MIPFSDLLNQALLFRKEFLDSPHNTGFRLLNGHLEGFPGLTIDIYASTLVINSTARSQAFPGADLEDALTHLRDRLPWINCALYKQHFSRRPQEKRGKILFGEAPDNQVREGQVWHALDLTMHQDASLYLDTRNVRHWAYTMLKNRSVLNCFAYTGSLGTAALAGGASRVIQTDLRADYLQLARRSYALNSIPVREQDFLVGDFWETIGRLKRAGERFDCVFLDPPFFSATPKGRFDLNVDSARLINKVRPLVNHHGWLVAVNNAVFLSGKDYMKQLEQLCQDGHLQIVDLVPVPEDCTGYPDTRTGLPPTDPQPFNHATKIAIMKVRRK